MSEIPLLGLPNGALLQSGEFYSVNWLGVPLVGITAPNPHPREADGANFPRVGAEPTACVHRAGGELLPPKLGEIERSADRAQSRAKLRKTGAALQKTAVPPPPSPQAMICALDELKWQTAFLSAQLSLFHLLISRPHFILPPFSPSDVSIDQ